MSAVSLSFKGISYYFTTDFTGTEALQPRELALIEHAGQKRSVHFSTGRFCGRKALGYLGYINAEILMGMGKEPLWPEGVCGSISHSNRLAGAVVAPIDQVAAIGLDIETVGGVTQEMWDIIYSQDEQHFLSRLPAGDMVVFSTLLFSIKESFYKCQYPLTGIFLEFKDVVISYSDGRLSLQILHPACAKKIDSSLLAIEWKRLEDDVICVCRLAAGSSLL